MSYKFGSPINESITFSLSKEINMDMFAEQFKTKAQGPPPDISKMKVKVAEKAPSKVSLLEANKAKNLAITLRKGGMSPNDICTAIERYVSAQVLPVNSKLDQHGNSLLSVFLSDMINSL